MSEKANAIIESAIAALRAEADDIHGKIAALEGALEKNPEAVAQASAVIRRAPPANGRRKRRGTKKSMVAVPSTSAPSTKSDKIKEAANKRAASWTPEKKKAAAERMRKYWAERKKAKG